METLERIYGGKGEELTGAEEETEGRRDALVQSGLCSGQGWWGKHRWPISRLTATWRRKSSEPCAPEEEVIEADEEEAKAMAGFLGFMAGHGGRAPAIV